MTGTSPHRKGWKSNNKTEHLSLKSKKKVYKRKLTISQPRKLIGDFSSKKGKKDIQSAWALAPCRGLETNKEKSATPVSLNTPSRKKIVNKHLENDTEMDRMMPHTCSRITKKKAILDSMIDDLLRSTRKVDRRFTFEYSELEGRGKRNNKKGLQPTWREQISPRIRKKIDFATDNVDRDLPQKLADPHKKVVNNSREHQVKLSSTNTLDRKRDTIERLSLEINAETNLDNELFLLQSKTSDDSCVDSCDSNNAEEKKTLSNDFKSNQSMKSPSQISNNDRFRDNMLSTPSKHRQSKKNRDVIKKEINDISIEYSKLRPESNPSCIEKDRRSSNSSTPRLERKLEGIEDLSILPHIEYSVLKLEATVSDLADQVKKKDKRIDELIGIIRNQEKRFGEEKKSRTKSERGVDALGNVSESLVDFKNEAKFDGNDNTLQIFARNHSSPRCIKSKKSPYSFRKDEHIQQIHQNIEKFRDDYERLKKSLFNAIQTAKRIIDENCNTLRHYVDEEIRVEKKEFEGSINELCVELENLRNENLTLQQKLQNGSVSTLDETHIKNPISKFPNDEKVVQKIDSTSFLGSIASPIPTMQSWNEFSIRFKDALSGNINNGNRKHCSLDAYGTIMAEKLFDELCFFQSNTEFDEGSESSDSEKDIFQDTSTIEISERCE